LPPDVIHILQQNAPNSISTGLFPRPSWGSLQCSLTLAGLKGPTSKRREGRKDGRERQGERMGRKGREGRGEEGKRTSQRSKFAITPLHTEKKQK